MIVNCLQDSMPLDPLVKAFLDQAAAIPRPESLGNAVWRLCAKALPA